MSKQVYSDLTMPYLQLIVNTRGTELVRFELDDGSLTRPILLEYESVWLLYIQLVEWVVRYLNKKGEE